MNKSEALTQAQTSVYKAVNNEGMVKVEVIPDEPITAQRDAVLAFVEMLAISSPTEMSKGQKRLVHMALKQNKVTTREAFEAFWKAYGDPYLSGGRIEFRNLMKYITEMRGAEKPLTYQQVCALVTKEGYDMNTDFEIINPESPGKKLWKRKTKT